MPIDYLDLRRQAKDEARKAEAEFKQVELRRAEATALLDKYAGDLQKVRKIIEEAAASDPRLRCAKPTDENMNLPLPLPALPASYTLIASDGSQINPDRHEPMHYFLINLGAIEFLGGTAAAPKMFIESSLHFAEYTTSGSFSQEHVNLERDKGERLMLARLAAQAYQRPVLTLTDGPMELWGEKLTNTTESLAFSEALNEYKKSLDELYRLGCATAGYVDKPRADLLVRMLEVIRAPSPQAAGRERPYRGVTDAMLLKGRLDFGQRSAVFATQSQSASEYSEHRALHFFYVNVGRLGAPWLARVEIPAWVANDKTMLDSLHAVLVEQTTIVGGHAYPYVLHRAHEIALVKFEEHEQVSRMLQMELRDLGIEPGELSQKQSTKNLRGRRRYKR